MVPFDRLHTPSYSTSKATIRLSLAVSEIWRDEKNVDRINKVCCVRTETNYRKSVLAKRLHHTASII